VEEADCTDKETTMIGDSVAVDFSIVEVECVACDRRFLSDELKFVFVGCDRKNEEAGSAGWECPFCGEILSIDSVDLS